MNTSEVLNRAADLIEERGWVQGIDGWAGPGGYCLEGGIAAAMEDAVPAFGSIPAHHVYTCPAYAAVAAYLGRDPKPATAPIKDALWEWNDTDTRTAEQVIAVLRAAALIEAAKENANTRESVTA